MSNASPTTKAAPGARPGPEDAVPWGTLSTVMIGMFMAILDSFIVVVAGPAIQAELGATAGELQWVLAGYQLSYAVVLITGGRLADLYGRRRVFTTGTAVFTLSSLACAVAGGPGVLIGARIVQGLGAALMVPQVFTVITLTVPARNRHRVFGVLGVVMGLASVGGQVVGGLLIGADLLGSGWRSVFWVNIPIGIATILLALAHVPESRAERTRKLDVPGVLVLGAALLLLTYPLIQGRDAGWPWWTWTCFAASALAFALFVVLERAVDRRGGEPLLKPSLFAQRSFSLGIVLVLAVYALLTSYYLALSVSMQDGLGMSALGAGLVYAPAAVTFFVCGLIAGRLVPKYGRRVLETGAVVLSAGYLTTAVVLLSGPRLTPLLVIPTLMLQSVGGGLLITPLLNTVLARIDPRTAGMASGSLSTAQQVGAALGVAIVGAVFFRTFRTGAASGDRVHAAGHAFALTSLTACAVAALAALLVFLLPKAPPAKP
ncbi:MFS transporter [Streptomyces sp. WELS2]|uniref:MFS transporter n=1 Tax=Streptomyces sp. WELS2 TaxID=2749435 RepID=UPI002867CD79|nr:MFS transporter [Streptomyces sp. WELS2]